MNFIYFHNIFTPREVKSMYTALTKQHYGSLSMMAIINAEYHQKLKSMNGQANGKYTYWYNAINEQKAAAKLIECLESGIFGHMAGLEINLVGTWVWAYGDTYPHRATLADLSFTRDYKRRMWYWKPFGQPQRSRQPMSGFVGVMS